MSIHFLHPTDRLQISEQADLIALEAEAMRDLAAALGRFEEATGRKVFVSDGLFATEGAEARWLADSEAGVYDGAMPADLTGVEIENAALAQQMFEAAAQAGSAFRSAIEKGLGITGDGSGEALPPIDTGSAETVTESQCRHLITHQTASGDGTVTCKQCGDELPSVRPAPAAPRRVNDYTRPMDAQDAPVTAHAAEAPTRKAPAALGVGRASYASGKPKVALKAKDENRPWGKLTLPEREIVKHLERLPDTFAPQDDLRLVELLTGGNKIDVAAAFLEVEPADALARWKSFLTEEVIGHDGKPTIDGQSRLMNALRYRVEDGDA